ncbi:hypothetical protein [Streptomyces sp. NPDC002788]
MNSAVERSCLGRIPILWRRWPIWFVAEGASRLTSGEEPGGVLWGADLGLAAAGRDELADQAGQGHGEDDRRGAERDGDGVAVEVDVTDGELADGGDLLCVEDQQQSRDAVRGRQGVVVEEAPGVRPAFLAVDGAERACPSDGAVGQVAGVPVLYRPADEVAGLVGVADRGVGHPAFQVRLGAGPDCEPFAAEPVEEVVRRGDVAAHVQVLEPSGVVFTEAAPEPAHVVPDRVAVQDPALCKVGAGLDGRGDPFLQGDQPLIARWQGAGRDQDTAQVGQHLARGQFVEDLVGNGPLVASYAFQEVTGLGAGDPGEGDVGALGARQRVVERGEFGADGPGGVAEEVAYLLVEDASLAGAGAELPGDGADRAAAPEVRVGVGALRAQRLLPGSAAGLGEASP